MARPPPNAHPTPRVTTRRTATAVDEGPIDGGSGPARPCHQSAAMSHAPRSEEHTSELQSRGHLVCRLLLEKKKQECLETKSFIEKEKQKYWKLSNRTT